MGYFEELGPYCLYRHPNKKTLKGTLQGMSMGPLYWHLLDCQFDELIFMLPWIIEILFEWWSRVDPSNKTFLSINYQTSMGEVIWSPQTSYDGTTFISDFVWQSCEIFIHGYNMGGVERYPSFAFNRNEDFCFDILV